MVPNIVPGLPCWACSKWTAWKISTRVGWVSFISARVVPWYWCMPSSYIIKFIRVHVFFVRACIFCFNRFPLLRILMQFMPWNPCFHHYWIFLIPRLHPAQLGALQRYFPIFALQRVFYFIIFIVIIAIIFIALRQTYICICMNTPGHKHFRSWTLWLSILVCFLNFDEIESCFAFLVHDWFLFLFRLVFIFIYLLSM